MFSKLEKDVTQLALKRNQSLQSKNQKNLNELLEEALATCHSLTTVKGNLVGIMINILYHSLY